MIRDIDGQYKMLTVESTHRSFGAITGGTTGRGFCDFGGRAMINQHWIGEPQKRYVKMHTREWQELVEQG